MRKSRCWGCCQENCGFTNCSCPCHGDQSTTFEMVGHKDGPTDDVGCYNCTVNMCNPAKCRCPCHMKEPTRQEPHVYKFYAIADNKDLDKARWYRTYSGHASAGFVDTLEKAKTWSRRGAAQNRCTNLGGSAVLVEFVVNEVNVIDQTEHRRKLQEKKAAAQAARDEYYSKLRLEQAEKELQAAQEKYNRLKKG